MEELLKDFFSSVDKQKLIDALKDDEDFNKLLEMLTALSDTDMQTPTIKIEMAPNDDNKTHHLKIETEGNAFSVISALANIVAQIMTDIGKNYKLHENAYENFGILVKKHAEKLKKEK